MGDEAFDVVIVGGGTKALITALYLQTYGGMKVGVFERMHEIGGALCSLERLAPGFVGDTHISIMYDWFYLPLLYDFPEFEELGGRFFSYPPALAIVFHERPDDCLVIYDKCSDPNGERSAQEIARYSDRDAETFLKLDDAYFREGHKDALLEMVYNLPPPPDQPDPLEKWYTDYLKRPDAVFDRQIMLMNMIQAGRTLFESMEYRCLMVSLSPRTSRPANYPFQGTAWFVGHMRREACRVVGGTHNIAHALIRLFVEAGGKFFTEKEVDKIIIDNETAKGIRLADGTEVSARWVVSGQDPYQLAFRLIGKEHLPRRVLRKVANLERNFLMSCWYTFAVRKLPHYRAAARNPDVNSAQFTFISDLDDMQVARETSLAYAGIEHERPQVRVCPTGSEIGIDPTRSPQGMGTILCETLTLPTQQRNEREWLKYKMDIGRYMIDEIHAVAPNTTWDEVIGVDTCTPYDCTARHLNQPTGNMAIIDLEPAQIGRFGPIAEWAQHRIPEIKNLYATGSAWGAIPCSYSGQGYKCYKAMAEDLGLRKPWEEKNRPW